MKSQVIGAFEAKTRLSELLDRVDKGQVYVITKRGRPVAELRPAARGARLQFKEAAPCVEFSLFQLHSNRARHGMRSRETPNIQ